MNVVHTVSILYVSEMRLKNMIGTAWTDVIIPNQNSSLNVIITRRKAGLVEAIELRWIFIDSLTILCFEIMKDLSAAYV